MNLTSGQTYTFIGPSVVSPNDNQCVTADMFGVGPITSFTVNINITMYGNVYLSGITSSSLSATTNANYKYIIPTGLASNYLNTYIQTWSGTSNNPTQYIFTISGGTTTHSPLLSYSQLNQVNSNNNRFQLSHLSGVVLDDAANIAINNADAFKIGTIPASSPRSMTVSYSGNSYLSYVSDLYLKQRMGTVTATTTYNIPGISTGTTSTVFSAPKYMPCRLSIYSTPLLPLSNYSDNERVACRVIQTSDVKTLSNQHLTRTIGFTLVSPIFHIMEV